MGRGDDDMSMREILLFVLLVFLPSAHLPFEKVPREVVRLSPSYRKTGKISTDVKHITILHTFVEHGRQMFSIPTS
jgi:hypothetical protein